MTSWSYSHSHRINEQVCSEVSDFGYVNKPHGILDFCVEKSLIAILNYLGQRVGSDFFVLFVGTRDRDRSDQGQPKVEPESLG
jgi:hypothetical protein